jgi:hypothetical protein
MLSFVFIFFVVPIVSGLTADFVQGRFRKKTVADEGVVSEVGDEPAVTDETPLQQVLPPCDENRE